MVPVYKLPTIQDIENMSNGKQTILIFEDLQSHISNLSNTDQNNLNSFVTRSRHQNISIMYVQHSFGYGGNSRHIFDKLFSENCTHVALFVFLANQLHSNLYTRRIFGDLADKFKQCWEISKKIAEHKHKRAYLIISHDLRQNLSGLSRIRCDIFGDNIIFKDGI